MSQISFIKIIPQQLGQPTTIAVVASLGIHALLGLSLPSISKASKQAEQNPQGHVKVVQLTPAEESRVPSLKPSPTVQQQSLPYQIQPLPPMPQLPSSISYPPLPSYPSISPNIPDDFWLTPPVKGTKSKSSKATKSKSTQIHDKQNPKPSSLNSTAPKSIKPAKLPRELTLDHPFPSVNSAPLPPAEPESLQPSANNTSNKPPNQPLRLTPDRDPPPDDKTYRKEGTDPDDYKSNFLKWASKNSIEPSKVKKLTLTSSYPQQEACFEKFKGTVKFGVQVDASGKVSPELLQKSGYRLLDQKALDTVNKNVSSKEEKAYAVEVNFDDDKKNCPALPAP